MKEKSLYVIKARWTSTAKTLKIEAFDEDQALKRALRLCKGCIDLDVLEIRELKILTRDKGLFGYE